MRPDFHTLVTGEVPSDVQDHLPLFSTLALSASLVIECGVRDGYSSTAWLHGLEQGGGWLISIDVDPQPFTHPLWRFIQGDDCSAEVLERLVGLVADIVFIDTSHAYEHTVREIELYRPFVRPGGIMLFHDTDITDDGYGNGPYEVRRALDDTFGPYGWDNVTGSCGLGMYQVPGWGE